MRHGLAVSKIVLEYGVWATVFCGNLREQTEENIFARIPTGISIGLLLQKSPKISGSLRKFTGECNLGILDSGPHLSLGPAHASGAPAVRPHALGPRLPPAGGEGDSMKGIVEATGASIIRSS